MKKWLQKELGLWYISFKRCAPAHVRKERIHIIHTVLFQRYRVLSLLGSGSSSNVYLAEHITQSYYRAIKCIPKTLPGNASPYLEADFLKNLRHPGIPTIYETEEDENYFYIIEEYIQGESLSAYVQSQNNISQETIISLGIQLCSIIAYLHQKPNSVLYLDFKPEHIILCGKQVKLLDFSTAIPFNKDGNPCQNCGTKGFAAPEQYTHGICKEQTDVFGIGAILYYMLTGQVLPPFPKISFTFPKYCSVYLKKIILKAISPSPKRRYASVIDLQESLQKISLGHTGQLPEVHLLKKIIIVGSQERIGVTHVAISLVSWLNHQGREAFYGAADKSPLPALLSYKEGLRCKNKNCDYQDFQAFLDIETALQAKNDHIFVEDMGGKVAAVAEEENADMIILVIGGRPWEIPWGVQAYEKLSDEENLILLCNYNEKQMARKYAGIFQKKVFCFPVDGDPFSVTGEKHNLFQQIFQERRDI